MKKLFFFRSSNSSSGNCQTVLPPTSNGNQCWESTRQNQVIKEVRVNSQSPEDLVSRHGKRYPESEDTSLLGLRRSLSFSSGAVCNGLGEMDLNCFSDLIKSPGNNFYPLHAIDYPICGHSKTPEKQPERKRCNQGATHWKTNSAEKLDSPSSTSYFGSSGNTPYSSPVPLRCRAACLTEAPNKILELYIDGEKQKGWPTKNQKRNSPSALKDGCLAQNKRLPSRQKPRMQASAPVSPNRDRLRSYSFRESRDAHLRLSTKDWAKEASRPASPQKLAKSVVERLCQAFPRKTRIRQQEFDSETTTTVEEIYEDYSVAHTDSGSNSNGFAHDTSFSDHVSVCHPSEPPYESINGYCTKAIAGFGKQNSVYDDNPVGTANENFLYTGRTEDGVDAELRRKGKEAEEKVRELSDELEKVRIQNNNFNSSALLQIIRNITNDRRNLALEVSAQIKHRIAERASADEALKQSRNEMDSQIRRLENEKNELQLSLEKELERRSSEWSLKLEKYQSEEQRLREQVRELAESNVSLHREAASFNGKEAEIKGKVLQSNTQLNEAMTKVEEAKTENYNLQQYVKNLQERCQGAESDRDCIKRNYKEKERENRDLQKAIARLQRICSEQERTVNGLREGLGDETGKQNTERNNIVVKLQMEQVRLTGVEQMLRKEVESFRLEVESLRQENINLLNRLCGSANGEGFSSFKLNQEVGARVDCLQNQCMLLLDEIGQLCGKLLGHIKGKACYNHDDPNFNQAKEISAGFDAYLVVEYDMKFQSSTRKVENLRKSLQIISSILLEKSNLGASELQLQCANDGIMGNTMAGQQTEGDVELELKAERLVTKVLREKLCFKELELERLQSELATGIRGLDILRCEVQRAQDSISSMNHKLKDLELQMLRKDENIMQIQCDLQECMKELTVTRGTLPKVTEERDFLWEEVKQYSEKNMLLNCEVNSLKKKIEALDEEILIKEGQISILKDSIVNKPFDILFNSPTVMKRLTLQ